MKIFSNHTLFNLLQCLCTLLNFFLVRVPEDGYYMFTLTIREDGDIACAGSIMRTPASDPNNAVLLCRAETGYQEWQMGSCTVRDSSAFRKTITFDINFE